MSVRRLDPVQPEHFAFTPANLVWAKEAIAKYPQGKQASAVIPILWRAQEQIGGWVTRPAMEYVARMLDISFIRVYEIATFYTMFQLSPVGRKAHVQLCGTTPCMLRGAEDLKEVCRRKIGEPHHLSADGDFSWEEVECLGACVNAPMVLIGKDTYEDLTPATFERVLDEIASGRQPKPGPQIDRQFSAPEGGPTTLLDLSLYNGKGEHGASEAAESPKTGGVPPSYAGRSETVRTETAPGIRSPSPEKTTEAEHLRMEKSARAEAHATPEMAPSRVARATKRGATSTAKRPPSRGVKGSESPPDDKVKK
jgi:NADH-quinone oxidoreductase subunit E